MWGVLPSSCLPLASVCSVQGPSDRRGLFERFGIHSIRKIEHPEPGPLARGFLVKLFSLLVVPLH